MRRFFSRGFRPSRRQEQLFPYGVRDPTGAGRESWHIIVTGRDSGRIGQNSWLFCPISLFSCSGGSRARAEKPATVELVPPGIYRRGLVSAGLVLGCVFSRPGTCRGEGKADLGEIYLLWAPLWGGTLRNPANTTRKRVVHRFHVASGKGVRGLLQSPGRRRPRSKRCPDRPRSSGEPDLDEMKPFPEIWPTEPGLFVYHEILVSLRLGAGVGSGPELRTAPLHPWNPKRNKNPPPAYRLGNVKRTQPAGTTRPPIETCKVIM